MKVFINPGHAAGGNPDPGCVNTTEHLRECDIALTVGSLAGKFLEAAGCRVKLLQSHNLATESPAYPSVTGEANRWLADVFVSIHVNAGGGRGAESFCYWKYGAGGRLAACIQRQLVSAMQAIDNGYLDRDVKERKGLCVLRETYMPAALVELGFIDSEDVRLLKEHQEDMARAVARGVTDYLQESLEGIKN
ncbi:N-acetylmuramoyl-L-alanine amidase family protein [Selenomonas ruminantium]|uniref:N-acetylmuramoyl-L-alanine amidase n=1 Tax=Selenomonas ruminantium TaxID=971 RepID=A0A1H3XIR9_SELRU|nr:N-acetylmuramoyl-L-alanine amidase [Selenomonas ruminantium]SDZ98448.1 N-acetylmuramoyl-L-alanine amidase [Selenomonas ruminantium]